MTISQEALTMYIFQPILARPIGMMKTKMSLKVISKAYSIHTCLETHASTFSIR